MARLNPSIGLIAAGLVVASALPLYPATAGSAGTPAEPELVLSVDASSSTRGDAFDLQTHGDANAFRDSSVIEATSELGGNGIAVMLFPWSASFQ